ncbi:MAG: fasciclin domain-containing protein [Bacteroidota bacterium]
MKKMLQVYKFPFFLLALLLTASCSSDDEGSTDPGPTQQTGPTLVELAQDNPELSSLVAALEAADGNLTTVLSGEGPFTVFAPSNTAFEIFLDGRALGDIPTDVLSQVLLNHVVAGENFSNSLNTGYVSSLSTAGVGGNNLSVLISTTNGVSINRSSTVTVPDLDASNGVVHIVDAVIGLPTVSDHVMANDDLIEFVDALGDGTPDTDFLDILSGEGPYTLFAPNNESSINFSNPDGNEISNVIFNHILLNTAILSTEFETSYDMTTAATNTDGDNLNIFVNTLDGVLLNGTSTVKDGNADVVATNGIVHLVDGVIDLPTLATFANADPDFTPLITALDAASTDVDFVSTVLSATGPSTIFAPINTAFDNLLVSLGVNGVDEIDGSELTTILLHHIIDGNIRAEDLTNGASVPTSEGDAITISLPGTGANIANITDGAGNSGIGIIFVDVQANNGVIHLIDTVLSPNTTN